MSRLGRGAFPNCLAFQRAGWRDEHPVRTASHRDHFWPAAYGTVTCEGEVSCQHLQRHSNANTNASPWHDRP